MLIPIFGFVGSAYATFACYFSMTIVSYFIGRKHYFIPYPIKRISFYFGLASVLFFTSVYFDLDVFVKISYIFIFIIVTFILEKPKKAVISNPKLFD